MLAFQRNSALSFQLTLRHDTAFSRLLFGWKTLCCYYLFYAFLIAGKYFCPQNKNKRKNKTFLFSFMFFYLLSLLLWTGSRPCLVMITIQTENRGEFEFYYFEYDFSNWFFCFSFFVFSSSFRHKTSSSSIILFLSSIECYRFVSLWHIEHTTKLIRCCDSEWRFFFTFSLCRLISSSTFTYLLTLLLCRCSFFHFRLFLVVSLRLDCELELCCFMMIKSWGIESVLISV